MRGDLHALVDGRLSPRRAHRVHRHIAECQACAQELDGVRSVRNMLSAIPMDPLPDGFEERLQRRLRLARREPVSRAWWATGPVVAAGLAGFVAAAVMASPQLARVPETASTAGTASAAPHIPAAAGSFAPDTSSVSVGQQTAASSGGAGGVPPASKTGATSSGTKTASETLRPSTLTSAATPPPAAEFLTIVTPSPSKAVNALSSLAAAQGGRALATVLGPEPPVDATLQAEIPPTSLAAFTQQAAQDGTIVADVTAPGNSQQEPPSVPLLITLLPSQPAPKATTPAPTPTTWRVRVLRAASHLWP
jgi:hypothetical protein